MTDTPNAAAEGGQTQEHKQVEVWDMPTRLFHWSLVFQVFVAMLTGYIFPEWWMETHIWAGHAIVVLIGFRLVWGFFGSEYSRFDTFWFKPAEVIAHIKDVRAGKPKHYMGHNPAGGLMIFGLLAVLFLLTTTGLAILGGEEKQGAFAGWANYQIGDIAKGLHSLLSILIIFMVAGHVGGVLMESKLSGENLIQTMVTGLKRYHGDKPPVMRPPHVVFAAIAAVIVLGGGSALLGWMATFPPSGHVALEPNKNYETDCGDCHLAYHPSLLPAASWREVMHSLDDHFGEDAWLDNEKVGEILAYLEKYSAETWDTEAANRFRVVSPEEPRRITATPYWVRKHENVKPDDFKVKSVGSKIKCEACHLDAKTGRFDDQQIRIPKE